VTNSRGDYAQSTAFLKKWRSAGPWILTSIHPDRKSISTQTFALGEEDNLREWLKKHGGDRNIYFSVNSATRKLDKKAERRDIAALEWLHVDVDPRPREDLKKEQERALKLLQDPPGGIPKPTCIVFSGGGYQGFWKLEKPFSIEGDLSLAEEAKRWNLQLELNFGADACHNVDRIMRLPGTINRPNQRKRDKGRVEVRADLIEWHEDRVYSLDLFTPAQQVQSHDGGFAQTVQVSGNIQRLASLDDLPSQVTDHVKAVITQGVDLDNPNKHPSRSEWLFWICCELIRGTCSDDVIYSIITDPDFKISESVVSKGSMADRYARRQIKRAHEEAIHPKLRLLNEKHAVISDLGGKCRIISEVPEFIGGQSRSKITYMSFADFSNRYCNQRIDYVNGQGNTISTQLGKWWVLHPHRLQFDAIVFEPGHDVPGAYNLWKGFAFDARPGGDFDLFIGHIEHNVCQGNQLLYRYVMGWMALAVQRPNAPGHTAVVLRGKRGTGKSFLAKTFGKLFGRHFMHISDPKHLVGSFNAHLQDCVVLFADEAFYAGDKKHEGVLKMLVTEETITLEKKGVDATIASNYVHLLMASNEEWVVPAGFDERRFLVLDVSDTKMQDTDYFGKMNAQMQNGGYEAFLHHLMTYNLTDFDVRSIPATKALQDQKILSFSNEQEWWYSKLVSAEIIEGAGWPGQVFASHLVHDFTSYTRLWNMSARGNSTRLGRFMKSCFPPGHKLRGQVSGVHEVVAENGELTRVDRPRVYLLPTLKVARDHWDKHFGGPYDWPEVQIVDGPPGKETSF